jgi:tRNA pseudouridine55 synthase
MIDGVLLIDKEKDLTSYDVVRKFKRVLDKGQKIGHGGTLDPFATGLLIVLLGKSTKEMQNILEMEKEYLVQAEFGYATDTQDITGEKTDISEDLKKISKKQIQKTVKKNFLGTLSQTPPQFSARKIKGKKAYEYAREKQWVELEPKRIDVKKFEIVNYNWPVVSFSIVCSSGTYIRTLIHDLGKELGIYSTAINLKRVRIGRHTLVNAISSGCIEEDLDLKSLKSKLLSNLN